MYCRNNWRGRIGSRVIGHLSGFDVNSILVSDRDQSKAFQTNGNIVRSDKQTIFETADVVSLHLPLTTETRNMVTSTDLFKMKRDAIILNTSRGGIINERDLYDVLKSGHLGAAAVDVFDKEPYEGLLSTIDRCVLTAHMGSMTVDCRVKMEVEATDEVIRFVKGDALESMVPQEEYDVQRAGLFPN